jgi:hypothetical protein
MGEKSKHNKLDSDCTLPPDHPLPPDQLGRYSPARDFYAEKDIAEYVLAKRGTRQCKTLSASKQSMLWALPTKSGTLAPTKIVGG